MVSLSGCVVLCLRVVVVSLSLSPSLFPSLRYPITMHPDSFALLLTAEPESQRVYLIAGGDDLVPGYRRIARGNTGGVGALLIRTRLFGVHHSCYNYVYLYIERIGTC